LGIDQRRATDSKHGLPVVPAKPDLTDKLRAVPGRPPRESSLFLEQAIVAEIDHHRMRTPLEPVIEGLRITQPTAGQAFRKRVSFNGSHTNLLWYAQIGRKEEKGIPANIDPCRSTSLAMWRSGGAIPTRSTRLSSRSAVQTR
jgi:hypothetical protein